jgi:ABC-type glycerol-3-phosphate transport system substrate-binding protein
MRKQQLFITLLVALTLILASCGGGAATQEPQAPAVEATEAPAVEATEAPAAEATEAPAAPEAPAAEGEAVTLTIDSWRNDDLTIWEDTIIPAFEAVPQYHVVCPRALPEYNGVLNTKLGRRHLPAT